MRNLGDASIYDAAEPLLREIASRLPVVQSVAEKIDNGSMGNIIQRVSELNVLLNDISGQTPAQFVPNSNAHLANIKSIADSFRRDIVPFLVIAQDEVLKDRMRGTEGEASEAARSYLNQAAETILSQLRSESESIFAKAKEQASAIQSTARDTATGVSLIQAQNQFSALLEQFKVGIFVFGGLSVAGFSVFVGYVIYLLTQDPIFASTPSAVYYAAIRVTLLASIAAAVSFTLKLFRANINMYYHTLHRQNLANSIPTFVEAARTDEQRDAILQKLIEAVSSFGQSGLIGGSDDLPNSAKIIVESIPKLISGGKP